MTVTHDGWVNLGSFGNTLRRLDPAFDPRSYGYERLSVMLNKYSNIIEQRRDEERFPPVVYVRLKSKKAQNSRV
jgi:hypothetical protein